MAGFSKGALPQAGVPGASSGAVMNLDEQVLAPGIAREIALVRASHEMAISYPRDDAECAAKLRAACGNPRFCKDATYMFERGGEEIPGGSVNLAREAVRVHPHIDYGLRILVDTPDEVHIQAWARDHQNSRTVTYEDKFLKKAQRKTYEGDRKVTRWVHLTDEREIRELIFRRGAIIVRNAIFGLLPKYLIDECVDIAFAAQHAGAKQEMQQPDARTKAIGIMIDAYGAIGVSKAQLEAKAGKDVSAFMPDDLVRFRAIYKSIDDGNSTVESIFGAVSPQAAAAKMAPATLDDLARSSEPHSDEP